MLNKFWGLSTPIKLLIGVGILILLLFVFDATTGWISNARSWLFNKEQAAQTVQIEKQLQEIEVLRKEKKEVERKALELEAKNAIYETREKDLTTKQKEEKVKIDKLLEEQAAEEQITAQETDAYTRCVRFKEKALAQNLPSAKLINCEVKK